MAYGHTMNVRCLAHSAGPAQRMPRMKMQHEALEERKIVFQNKYGFVRVLKGWVERDADALGAIRSILRQNGGSAKMVYDARYGFGIGGIRFSDGEVIGDFQFYVDGKIPVLRIGNAWTGLNLGNVELGNRNLLIREESPKGDFCFGNTDMNTEGIKVRLFESYDPLTNTILPGISALSEDFHLGRGPEILHAVPLQAWIPKMADGVEGDFIAEGAKAPKAADAVSAAPEACCSQYAASLVRFPDCRVEAGRLGGIPDNDAAGFKWVQAQMWLFDARPAAVAPVLVGREAVLPEPCPREAMPPRGEREAAPASGGRALGGRTGMHVGRPVFVPQKKEGADPQIRRGGEISPVECAGAQVPEHGKNEWGQPPARAGGERTAEVRPARFSSGDEGVGRNSRRVKARNGVSEMLRGQEALRRKKVEERRNRERRKVSASRPAGRKKRDRQKQADAAGKRLPRKIGRAKEFGRFKENEVPGKRMKKGKRARAPVAGAAVKEKALRRKRVVGKARMPAEGRKIRAKRRRNGGIMLDEEMRKANRRKERAGERRRGKDAVEYLAAKKAKRPKKRKRWVAISKR